MSEHFPLKEETYRILGACFDVYNELGCGFLEPVYQEALEKELTIQKIPFKREVELPIYYKNDKLTKSYRADFICLDKIVLELKALSAITPQHEAQVLNYLKATKLQLGLLVNFGQKSLVYKRIIKTSE